VCAIESRVVDARRRTDAPIDDRRPQTARDDDRDARDGDLERGELPDARERQGVEG
jgi:hypothetical protein